MDTFMTFISGGNPVRKERSAVQDTNNKKNINNNSNTSDSTPRLNTDTDITMSVNDAGNNYFEDDFLDEFLNPQYFEQQNELNDFTDNNNNSNHTASTDNIDGISNNNNDHDTNNILKQNDLLRSPDNSYDDNMNESPMDSMTVLPDDLHPALSSQNNEPNTINLAEELKKYEESKEQLLNVKFGLTADSKYIHHSSIGFCYTKSTPIINPDDPEVTTTVLPQEYHNALSKNLDSFPFKLKLADLPTHSRVETQIKLELSVSPPPPQFLLHIPRDSVTKPKFTLANNSLPDSIKDYLLYLDIFVVGSESLKSKDGKLKSYNVCKRCMRRELKRASRRKAGLVDDSSNWDINLPKRAIIINSKEIVSFPAPNGNLNERKLELLSRIVCYCRHHQEVDGFRILIFLKDKNGKIVGRVSSTPILIMDRKKSVKSGLTPNIEKNKEGIPSSSSNLKRSSTTRLAHLSHAESSSELSVTTSVSTSAATNFILSESKDTLTNTISNLNIMNVLSSNNSDNTNNNNSKKSQTGMFSSLFSFDPSNILGDENSRQVKRQKRPWIPSESTSYFETINQQRGITSMNNSHSEASIIGLNNLNNNNRTIKNSKVSIKKEAVSPLSSDAISPQHHLQSSATSVFSLTPERKMYEKSANSLTTPPFNDELNMNINNIKESSLNSEILDVNLDINIGNMINNLNNNLDHPVIRRIIPAQGPIRGGIEITLLGSNFRSGLTVKFGSNIALATQCWSDTTIVTYLPPASQAGPVLVTFEDPNINLSNSSAHQIFTYTDDTDRQLIELALQIVGLKMNGKLEDAKNIAKRIVGNNQIDSQGGQNQSQTQSPASTINQQLQLNWMAVASNKIKELSKTSLNHEEILIKFLNMIKIPNSLISSPNWGVCNSEGQTMLHLASFKNYTKLSYFLIKNGSRIDYKDRNGFTPLHFAFISGNRKMINLLNKFNANCLNKLDNGVLLSDISDSNVLDLINDKNTNRRSSTDSTDLELEYVNSFEGEIDDEENEENEGSEGSEGSEPENEDFSYGYDYYQISYGSRSYPKSNSRSSTRNKSQNVTQENKGDSFYDEYEDYDDYDSDVYNEDSSDSHSNKIFAGEKKLNNAKEGNSFGINLWIAMKEAITNKMNEFSDAQYKVRGIGTKKLRKSSAEEVNCEKEEEEDILPKYDDLFPQGSSLRSLINFRGYGGEDDEGYSKKGAVTSCNNSEIIEEVVIEEDKDSDVDLIAMNLRTSINADTKLLFFWLPCMLLLLLIIIGSNLNMIKLENFQHFSYFLEKVREYVGSFMLGKDRFTNLINENINYGRERMENLINDVNGAVMTAVAGVGR